MRKLYNKSTISSKQFAILERLEGDAIVHFINTDRGVIFSRGGQHSVGGVPLVRVV